MPSRIMISVKTNASMAKLGIIAGNGDLPKHVISRCRKENRPYFVLAFRGHTDPEIVQASDHEWVNIGAIGHSLKILKQVGVQELLMAGSLERPSWSEIRPDWKGIKLLKNLMKKARGDDSMFKVIISELEKEGFRVIGASDIIGDEILAPKGILGTFPIDEDVYQDIQRGIDVARALGDVDVGQSVIVQQGIVLGVEAIEGTKHLIERCQNLKRPGPGGVLVKISKTNQDHRVDLPTIGLDTIEQIHQAGLQGIAIEAQAVQILSQEEVISKANQYGIFIVGISLKEKEDYF